LKAAVRNSQAENYKSLKRAMGAQALNDFYANEWACFLNFFF
jgi:hypothetical protein